MCNTALELVAAKTKQIDVLELRDGRTGTLDLLRDEEELIVGQFKSCTVAMEGVL